MFGYVVPCKPELKVKEWQEYRGAYCGLCKQLKRDYGFVSRFFLNYDFVFLSLIADGLLGIKGEISEETCISNPIQKRPVCGETQGLNLASNSLILTVYYKLQDDVYDEKFLKKLFAMALKPFAEHYRKKAAIKYPLIDEILSAQTKAQQEIEQAKSTSADAAADPTAQMTAALFSEAGNSPQTKKILHRFGLFLGKIIYYLDAAEDYDKDKADGSYNVFILQGLTKAEAIDEAIRLCKMCAGELSLCYNLLEFTAHKPLIENILFLGIPQSISRAGQPAPKKEYKNNL